MRECKRLGLLLTVELLFILVLIKKVFCDKIMGIYAIMFSFLAVGSKQCTF